MAIGFDYFTLDSDMTSLGMPTDVKSCFILIVCIWATEAVDNYEDEDLRHEHLFLFLFLTTSNIRWGSWVG